MTDHEPVGSTVYTGITIPVELWRRLRAASDRTGLARNSIAVAALTAYLDDLESAR